MSLEKGLAQNSVTLIGEKSASPSFAHFDWVHSIRSPFGSALHVNIDFISEAPNSLPVDFNNVKQSVKTLWTCWTGQFGQRSSPEDRTRHQMCLAPFWEISTWTLLFEMFWETWTLLFQMLVTCPRIIIPFPSVAGSKIVLKGSSRTNKPWKWESNNFSTFTCDSI